VIDDRDGVSADPVEEAGVAPAHESEAERVQVWGRRDALVKDELAVRDGPWDVEPPVVMIKLLG
jgi:hypothetical protein